MDGDQDGKGDLAHLYVCMVEAGSTSLFYGGRMGKGKLAHGDLRGDWNLAFIHRRREEGVVELVGE